MTDIYAEEQRAQSLLMAEDYPAAAQLFESLAERGSNLALLNLGYMHEKGFLGTVDIEKAISYYEKAASAGSALARHYLGVSWRMKGDLQRARVFFIEGAEMGNKACMNMAGRMLVRGQGGDADLEAGTLWLTRAADLGHLYAKRDLWRLEIKKSHSLWRRFWLRCKLIWLPFETLRQILKNPNSINFR